MKAVAAGKPRIKPRAATVSGPPSVRASAHTAASSTDPFLQSWTPLAGSADADLIPELGAIVPRTRDLVRNNGIAAGANQTCKDNIVGHVLRLSAKPDARLLGWDVEQAAEWSKLTEAQFRSWADSTECDAGRTMTLLGLTTQAIGATFHNGEAVAIPVWQPLPNRQWATRLMVVEADRLSTPPGREGQANMRGGIEVDRFGAPIAYWIRRRHPGDRYELWAHGPDDWERIPAFTPWGRRRVIHLHDKERTGQSRGKPALTAIVKQFALAGRYGTAELESAVSSAMIAAVIESGLPPESVAEVLGVGDGNIDTEDFWNRTSIEAYLGENPKPWKYFADLECRKKLTGDMVYPADAVSCKTDGNRIETGLLWTATPYNPGIDTVVHYGLKVDAMDASGRLPSHKTPENLRNDPATFAPLTLTGDNLRTPTIDPPAQPALDETGLVLTWDPQDDAEWWWVYIERDGETLGRTRPETNELSLDDYITQGTARHVFTVTADAGGGWRNPGPVIHCRPGSSSSPRPALNAHQSSLAPRPRTAHRPSCVHRLGPARIAPSTRCIRLPKSRR